MKCWKMQGFWLEQKKSPHLQRRRLRIQFMRILNRNAAILPLKSGAKLFLLVLVGLVAGLTSCKESDIIGLDVQPPNDLIGADFQDTTTLITKTVYADSLRTDESLILTGDAMIGSYWDPVFGKANASLYTQLRLSALNPSFGTSPVVDSVVLSLAYNSTYYGKTDRKKQRVNVYQVSEDIKGENSYYSNHTVTVLTGDLAASYEFTPRPADSVYVTNKKLKPHLRIPLDTAWAHNLITQNNFATTAAFQSAMKGLHITTEGSTVLSNGDGNILYFRCGDDQSKVTVYYHNAANDSLTFDFLLGSVARFSSFNHIRSGENAQLAAQLDGTSPAQNNTVFIQSMAGVKTKIEMPYLMNWLNAGGISVNKAELVIKVDVTPTYMLDTFAAPTKLVLFGINDDGTSYVLPDANEGATYFGGTYNTTDKEYRFNIGRYIQQVLAGTKKNNGLYLLAANGAINANRVVLGGGSSSLYPMKLRITYTKLE